MFCPVSCLNRCGDAEFRLASFSFRNIGRTRNNLQPRYHVTMPEKEQSTTPSVGISRRGADRIRAGHVWVYRSDVVDSMDIPPGALVTVAEKSDRNLRPTRTLGSAFYSSASEIAVRMISRKPVDNIEQLIRERIRAISFLHSGRYAARGWLG